MQKDIFYLTGEKIRFVRLEVFKDSVKMLKDKRIKMSEFSDPAFIKELIQKEGFKESKFLSCFFRHQLVLRFFSFPSINDKEIERMVKYELADILPLKHDETVTRFFVCDKKPDGYSEVMVAVVPKEESFRLFEKCRQWGTNLLEINLSSLALLHCAKKFIFEKNNTQEQKSSFMLFYIEDNSAEGIIFENSKIALSRGFVFHSERGQFGKEAASEILQSIRMFLEENAQRKLDKIILCGREMDLDGFKTQMSRLLDYPIEVNNDIDMAYGLAWSGKNEMNLLPDELISSRKIMELKNKFIFLMMLVFANVILLIFLMTEVINVNKAYLKKIKEKIEILKPQAQTLQDKLLKIKTLKTQLNSQVLILEAITDLAAKLPSGCTLNMLSINEEGLLVIRGQAGNLQEVLDFVMELGKSAYFNGSHLNYSSQRKVENKEILDFEIQALLKRVKTRKK